MAFIEPGYWEPDRYEQNQEMVISELIKQVQELRTQVGECRKN